MPPTDDDLGLRLLGEIQALRNEILMLGNREQARAVKAKLVALHEASRGETVSADVAHIVDEFFTLSKASIVKSYGTAAWDEPETIEEAKARMGKLPAAPGSQYTADQQREGEASLAKAARELGPIAAPGPGVLDRVNEREPPPLTDQDLARIEGYVKEGSVEYQPTDVGLLVAEVRHLRTFLLTLQGGLVGPPKAAKAWDVLGFTTNDPGRLLSEDELAAADAVVRAAIQWTDVTGPTKVSSSFDLIMAELRRLRRKA